MEVALGEVFLDTNISCDAILRKGQSETHRKEGFTTLKMMWDSRDLSFARDPNSYDYIHRSNDNNNLSLSVTNQMMVSNNSC